MLGFFRKYQKFFFIIVTFFIVISFSFFGTFDTLFQDSSVPDKEIGKLVDGSSLSERKFQGFLSLLQNGMEEGGRSINMLSDSLIHKDFIMSGLGETLALHYFDALKPELELRWKRVKNYAPYTHPYAPNLSARYIWGQFAPQINALLDEVQKAPAEFSKESLPLLFNLYRAQAAFPSHHLQQIIYYFQEQSEGIRKDLSIAQANFSLFGFQSLEDWFGQKFLECTGKFILNAACIAKQEGYDVSKEEAKANLISNVTQALEIYQQGQKASADDVQKYYQTGIRYLGLDETSVIENWRDSLCFRRFFEEVGSAVFLDPLTFDQFSQFAKPSLHVVHYQMPEHLKFTNLRDMFKFQHFLEMTRTGDLITLQNITPKNAELVRQEFPEIVYKSFEVEMASLTKEEASHLINLKATWDWELNEGNFKKIQSKFPGTKNGDSLEARQKVLDDLAPSIRLKVDQFARAQLLEENKDWMGGFLKQAKFEKKALKVRVAEESDPLSGSNFLALLESEAPELSCYTVDNATFYSIKVLGKEKGWHVYGYQEANAEGKLDQLLDKKLEIAHQKFGMKKAFEEAKDEVGMKVYSELLKGIQNSSKIAKVEECPQHRFDPFLQSIKSQLMNEKEISSMACSDLFKIEQSDENWSENRLALKVGECSPIDKGAFFQVVERKEVALAPKDMEAAKEYLKMDAQQELMRKLLQKL